jgi:hypothetical protein
MAEVSNYYGGESHGRAPGVHIHEIARIPGAATATGVPLFIGFARIRPEAVADDGGDEPKFVRLASWEQFEQTVELDAPVSFLGYAVRGFFENGGQRCVVVPLRLNDDQLQLLKNQPERDREPLSKEAEENCRRMLAHALEGLFGKDNNGLRRVISDIDDTDLVCAPDIMMKFIRAAPETVFELQRQVLEYCKDMGERFAILDMLPGETNDVEKSIRHWRELMPTEGALYFPWVLVQSLRDGGAIWVPPCGHVAGIYARTDQRVGFHKAPANEIVEGVLDLQSHVSEELNGQLNDIGVNCLRSFARRGIRVWGARTLSGHRNWRYVNVRRTFLTLVRWIEHNMNDLVFEPNNPLLWDRVRERLGGYCYELFEGGALKGRDAAEAFFVKCDEELNSLEVREAGQVICEIGLAPLAPAEFIVIRITQSAAGIATAVPAGA